MLLALRSLPLGQLHTNPPLLAPIEINTLGSPVVFIVRLPKSLRELMHTIGLSRAWRLESLNPKSLVAVRQFNLPTGLHPGQQVWFELRLQSGCHLVRVEFNGNVLPNDSVSDYGVRWMIKSLLPNNRFRIEVCASEELSPSQSLEIAKRLLDMSLWFKAELQIA